MNRLAACFVPGLAALFATACGTVSDGADPALIATIQGRLTNAEAVDVPDTIRVAVLWQSALDAGHFVVAQDVAVEPVFPAKFRLAVTAAPPESALVYGEGPHEDVGPNPDGDDEGDDVDSEASEHLGPRDQGLEPGEEPTDYRLALGFLVAYEDTNGNGKLDLVDEGATQFTDRILGANKDLLLLYAEGNVAHPELRDPDGHPVRAGYNLLRLEDVCANEQQPGVDPYWDDCSMRPTYLPIDSLYDLPITNDPEFSELMCKNGGGDDGETSIAGGGKSGPDGALPTDPGPAGYPEPGDDFSCDAGGRAYYVTTCTTTELGPCRGASTSCIQRHIGLPAGDVPAGWPCTVTP